MTLTTVRDRARRLSRTDSTFASDAELNAWINEGKNEMSSMVGGFRKEEYLTLSPRFDTVTSMGIRITITGGTNAQAAADVAITDTDRTDTAASTIASDLQTAIRTLSGISTATVVFNTSGDDIWKFTIDSIDGTDIAIAAPSGINYSDATSLLFNKTGASGAQTWVSNIPSDVFVETDLGAGWETIDRVEWDTYPLIRGQWDAAMSVEQMGDPVYFAVSDMSAIRIWPTPNHQDQLHIAGRGEPADITAAITFMPTSYHNALAHYAASQLAEENFETTIAEKRFASFRSYVRRYKAARVRGDSRIGAEYGQTYGRQLENPGSVTL